MTKRIDILTGMVEEFTLDAYQAGKARRYGEITEAYYTDVLDFLKSRGSSPPTAMLPDPDAPKVKQQEAINILQLEQSVISTLCDSQAFRTEFLQQAGKLVAFAREIEMFVHGDVVGGHTGKGQLPLPPLGFGPLRRGADKGKLGFPENHRYHPNNVTKTRPPGRAVNAAAMQGHAGPPPSDPQAVQAAGASACLAGYPKTANPWPRRAAAHGQWLSGWVGADEPEDVAPESEPESEPEPESATPAIPVLPDATPAAPDAAEVTA